MEAGSDFGNFGPDFEGRDMFRDVMHAKNGGSARKGGEIGREGRRQPILGRRSGQRAEKTLSRHANQHRQGEMAPQYICGVQRLQVLAQAFTEADARIEDDLFAPDAGLFRQRERGFEKSQHIGDNVERWVDLLVLKSLAGDA